MDPGGELDRTQKLIARARDGEKAALEELFTRYGENLRRSARHKLPPSLKGRIDSSDVAQDALLDAVAHFDQFEYRGEGSFRRWMNQILSNRALMVIQRYLGRQKRDLRREVHDEDRSSEVVGTSQARQFASPRTSPSGGAMRNERRQAMQRALLLLEPDHRQVIELVRIEEKSIAEAAAAMGRTENAVKKLLARALLALREALDKVGGVSRGTPTPDR